MRRTTQRRTSGRPYPAGELFPHDELAGEVAPAHPDAGFPLRPLAAEIPQGARVDPHAAAEETATERLLRLARKAALQGRIGDAAAAFRELLTLEPAHLTGRVEFAILQERQGDLDAALAHLFEAVELRPQDPAPLIARGAFLARLKRHREAEADLHRAIKLAPEDANAHFELGFALWRKGVAEEAAAALRRAATLAPHRSDAEYYLGEALHQAGDHAGALAALERAATLDTGNPKPLQLMGRVLDRLGRPEEAREMYRRAREAAPR